MNARGGTERTGTCQALDTTGSVALSATRRFRICVRGNAHDTAERERREPSGGALDHQARGRQSPPNISTGCLAGWARFDSTKGEPHPHPGSNASSPGRLSLRATVQAQAEPNRVIAGSMADSAHLITDARQPGLVA